MVATLTQQNSTPLPLPEQSLEDWYNEFKQEWQQGEHVSLIGQTGTGKTTVAHVILDIRSFVAVLAIKRKDDTLERFREGDKFGRDSYKVITKWPPDYPNRKVVLWVKPKSLAMKDIRVQSAKVYDALNRMYLSGGWCIYLDEAGYLAGTLGLSSAIGILLNQGRSAFISVVATMTRPSSVIARIPKEALTQVRHHLIFKYTDEREMKICGEIVGLSLPKMRELQNALRWYPAKNGTTYSDFLYIGKGKITIVRNSQGKN